MRIKGNIKKHELYHGTYTNDVKIIFIITIIKKVSN